MHGLLNQLRLVIPAVFLLDLALAGWGHHALAAPAPGAPDVPRSYEALYEKILAAARDHPSGDPGTNAALSDAAFRIWERTGDKAYQEEALRYFGRAVTDPRFNLRDFHLLQHFGELAWRMNQEKIIPPEYLPRLRDLARTELEAFCRSADNADYNIRVGQVAGYAGLLKFLDGQPFEERDAAQRRLNQYWEMIARTGDLDEDASNYDSLGAVYMVDLARLMGREQVLKTPAFRRFFTRFRDIVSPAGLIPEYGDAYFSYDNLPLDRLYLLEYAARLYNDPTFLYAADKLWDRPQQKLPAFDFWIRAFGLIDLSDTDLAPQMPVTSPSVVMLRAVRGKPDPVVDKLILRTGWEPGASMVMMDLYASGSHAHTEKGPSIGYYESDQVPLFHNMGRHQARSAIDGNVAWASSPSESFPGFRKEGQWFTMRIPVERLSRGADGKYELSGLFLRNFPERNHNVRSLSFDNLRLEGPAGTWLVDSFDASTGWKMGSGSKARPVTSTDKTQGDGSQQFAWNQVTTTGVSRTFPNPPPPFTRQQYTVLKLDLKYQGARPYMQVRGLGDQVDLSDHLLRPDVESARVEQRGQDAFGQVRFTHYIQGDTGLTRQMVLTAEGFLVVRDVLTPGPSMAGWTAGQLWQLYALSRQGPNWFCSEDDGAYPALPPGSGARTRRMLIRFAVGNQSHVEEVTQDYYAPNPRGRPARSFFTTFSQRPIHPGRPEIFVFVVAPNDPAVASPEEAAKAVAVTQEPDGSALAVLTPGGRKVTIRIGDDAWSVVR